MFVMLANLSATASVHAQCNPDITAPAITCPPNISVQALFGECEKVVDPGNAVATDNCPNAPSVTNNAPAGNVFPPGTTDVIFTATDAAGNVANCVTQVKVTKLYGLACNALVTIPQDVSGVTEVFPDDIEEGGGYCFPRQISLQGGQPAPSVSIAGTGSFIAVLWMLTPDAGWVQCWSELEITGASGTDDLQTETGKKVVVSPQPAENEVVFRLPVAAESAAVQLYNAQGQMVKRAVLSGDLLRLTDTNEFSGLYFYTIQTTGNDVFSGKIIMK